MPAAPAAVPVPAWVGAGSSNLLYVVFSGDFSLGTPVSYTSFTSE